MVEDLDWDETRISNEMNWDLARPFIAEEVTQALHQMNPSKLPGPNDMSILFF